MGLFYYLTKTEFYVRIYQLFLCIFGGIKMFLSFGHRLRGLGNVHVGFRMKGSTGCLLVGIYGFMNFFIYLLWYTLLACFWLVYGVCYLYYLLFKGIVLLCKKLKQNKQMPKNTQNHTTPSQPQSETNDHEE